MLTKHKPQKNYKQWRIFTTLQHARNEENTHFFQYCSISEQLGEEKIGFL